MEVYIQYIVVDPKFLLAERPFFDNKKLTSASLSRTPCLTFAGGISSKHLLGLVVLHNSLYNQFHLFV